MIIQDYLAAAKQYEAVFRNVLKDLAESRGQLPMGEHIPEDLDHESELETIFGKYSPSLRKPGEFAVIDFRVLSSDLASILFEKPDQGEGGAAEIEYKVNEDNSVAFFRAEIWKC